MAKTLVHQELGGPGTPQEIKDIRKASYDLHGEIGAPVVFKHRWNIIDEREGRARKCPFHDELYEDSPDDCPYCFGTGYVGGFADGVVMFLSLKDAPTDVIKLTPQGLLQMDTHPQVSAPWLPEMQDGDMIILAEFNPRTWEVIDVAERFTLREVNPVTLRGPGFNNRNSILTKRQRVSQESNADKLPFGHQFYEVPIVFDYDDVPDDPTPPDDPDPPSPTNPSYTLTERVVKVRGDESSSKPASRTQEVRVAVLGDNAVSNGYGVRVTGKSSGTVIVNL